VAQLDDQEQWQLDGSAAELYQRYLVPAVTSIWAEDLVARAHLQPGMRVLDVACGTGVVARLAAERVGAQGRVAGLDVNRGMLEVAQSLPPAEGADVEWHEASVLAMPFPAATFDVAFCQLGLQFFPDRPAALREVRRVLVPGGIVALSVYSAIERNPASHALSDALDRVEPGTSTAKRSEHALADVAELRAFIVGAAFRDPVVETVTKIVRYPSVADYVRIQLCATPLASLLTGTHEGEAQFLVEEVEKRLAEYVGRDGLAFPQEAHVLVARS
jgi:ubiquinone/menaquinone biosynthesis C-methylase UbiE